MDNIITHIASLSGWKHFTHSCGVSDDSASLGPWNGADFEFEGIKQCRYASRSMHVSTDSGVRKSVDEGLRGTLTSRD